VSCMTHRGQLTTDGWTIATDVLQTILGRWTRADWLGGRLLDRGRRFAGNLLHRCRGHAAFFGAELASAAAASRRLASAGAGVALFGTGLLAFDHRFGELAHDDLNRAHRIVVAGNRQVDQI